MSEPKRAKTRSLKKRIKAIKRKEISANIKAARDKKYPSPVLRQPYVPISERYPFTPSMEDRVRLEAAFTPTRPPPEGKRRAPRRIIPAMVYGGPERPGIPIEVRARLEEKARHIERATSDFYRDHIQNAHIPSRELLEELTRLDTRRDHVDLARLSDRAALRNSHLRGNEAVQTLQRATRNIPAAIARRAATSARARSRRHDEL